MSTFKKLLALTLALAMVLSVSAFAGYSKDTYKDAANIDEDCESAVELMYALDIMTGDANGNFNPTATITRAEVVKMIYVILNYGEDDLAVNYKGAKIFSDVPAGTWYEGYVNYAYTHKLVNGRGNGTFGPNDPVTTAEAAKMLLTAIGYSAEARGYTGANWAFNVLSDARILGLLNGYNYSTTGYAPRQWVAVMFENALFCYTFDTMRPTFDGLLISGSDFEYDKMGKKYFGLDEFEAVAIATTNAAVDKYDVTGTENDKDYAEDYVLFSNGKEIKGTGLKAADLGQTYRVIHDGKAAYSVRSLYETAEARILDIETDIVYGTSSNKANNKYEFTVDGVTAKFAAKEINILYTGTEDYATTYGSGSKEKPVTGYDTISVTEFYDLVESEVKTNDQYKIILNDDGEIAYIIVTEYAYGYVNKDGSHNKYGDYIVVDKDASADETDLLTFNGEKNLYLDDCIISEDEIVEDNIVKYTWDLDEGMFVMEVLPIVEDVVYEARDNKAKIYTIGGEDYYVVDEDLVLTDVQDWVDDKDNLDESICLVVDGDMIVYHWFSDSDIDNMDDINAKLALVIDVDATYSTGTLHEKPYIEYMTIDGETHIAEYQNKSSDYDVKDEQGETDYYYVQFEELEGLALKKTMTEKDLEGRLFIIHEGTKDRVYLEKLILTEEDEDEPNTQLDASTSLLNLYEEKTAKLDATGSAVKYDGDTMAADNTFFYSYIDDGEAVFGVITPAEFGDGEDETVYGQTLSYVKSPSGRQTVLGGYVVVELDSDSDSDYLYITKIGKETADGVELTVQIIGGEEQTIYVDDEQTFYTDLVYAYTYATMDDEWTLTLVDAYDKDVDGDNYDAGFWAERVVKWYDEEYNEIYLKAKKDANDKKLDVSDDDYVDHIVITTIEYVRDETQSEEITGDDSDYLNADLYEEYDRTLEIVAYEELEEADIANDETDSYVQTGYWYYSADADMLYVVVVRDMTQAQDAE